MTPEDFCASAPLAKCTVSRKKTVNGDDVKWMKIQWIRFEKSRPEKMLFKYTTQEVMPFLVCDLSPLRKNRGSLKAFKETLPQLYGNTIPIKSAKLKDLHALLDLVPPIHHGFYHGLSADKVGHDTDKEEDGEEDD